MRDRHLSVPLRGDHDLDPVLGAPGADGIGVVGAVADEPGERYALEQRLGMAAVRGLARRQQVAQGPAATVGQDVDLGGQPATRPAEILLAAAASTAGEALRLALIKVAAHVTELATKIKLALPSSSLYRQSFTLLAARAARPP